MATRNTALAPTMEKVCPAWITKPTLETAPMVARIVVLAIPSQAPAQGVVRSQFSIERSWFKVSRFCYMLMKYSCDRRLRAWRVLMFRHVGGPYLQRLSPRYLEHSRRGQPARHPVRPLWCLGASTRLLFASLRAKAPGCCSEKDLNHGPSIGSLQPARLCAGTALDSVPHAVWRPVMTSKQAAYTQTGDHETAISFEDIGKFPGRACVGRMGAPTCPSFTPYDPLIRVT